MLRHVLPGFILFFQCCIAGGQSNTLVVSEKKTAFPLFTASSRATICIDSTDAKLVKIAAEALANDMEALSGKPFQLMHQVPADRFSIIAGTINQSALIDELIRKGQLDVSAIKGKWECFLIKTLAPGKLLIAGADPRGTAYGIFHLSKLMGVSPWVWWADAIPARKQQLYINGTYVSSPPSVKYRGIFLNDEDWGLQPWAAKTFEPETGDIGPKTYAKIFELMLRLKANLIWPAMHPSTKPFFYYPGNAKMATDYGIVIGSSHAEPMLRNNVDEWDEKKMGEFNYLTNHDMIYRYWEDRIKQSKSFNTFYTLGIRGVHDSKMLGANTLAEQKTLLDQAVKDQRQLLAEHINTDITQVPQAFIPYKEVQEIYDNGFQVPEDVTLVWCDDNYGYIRHFPDQQEASRKGGNGIYYHVSYWGRPHDYLWLASTHPALICSQMKMAYEKNARDIWVVNVGDIKPAEYLTELFLDLAWDATSIESSKKGMENHLLSWLTRTFGSVMAKELLPLMLEYYRLAYIRKPEFMGGTRTEESDPRYKIIADLPWSEKEIRQRIREYALLDEQTGKLAAKIPAHQKDAWFQLIEYPVRGAAAMNYKLLQAQLARYGKSQWAAVEQSYDTIVKLTERYNNIAFGKWRYIMDFNPRKLAVYGMPDKRTVDKPIPAPAESAVTLNAVAYKTFTGKRPIKLGMGYQSGAVSISMGSSVCFPVLLSQHDSVTVSVALAPVHPVNGKTIRFGLQWDQQPVIIKDYSTQGRSEEWKQNVLSNQSIRTIRIKPGKAGQHQLRIIAIDEGVILDQVKIFF